jgi:SAM-dependent methyltransferase
VNFEWINTQEIENIEGKPIVLFGAGKGAEEFIGYLQGERSPCPILAIADNDPSYWGKSLCGYRIVSPESIPEWAPGKIVVTSVSGREAIALQLQSMGYDYPQDFILIGRYPQGYFHQFKLFMESVNGTASLENRELLHVGPGGFLGLEVLLAALGAKKVSSIDKFSFGMRYPDISSIRQDYEGIKSSLDLVPIDCREREQAEKRFETLFKDRNGTTLIDPENISYRCPMDVCDMSFSSESFDFVLSFSVLEHVSDPAKAVQELARVLKAGGLAFQTITTQDHRSFSKVAGYNPFSFRSYSAADWEQIASRKFYQNRVFPAQWRDLFEQSGLQVRRYDVGRESDCDGQMLAQFHPDFHRFSRTELSQIDCTIIAVKQ